LHHRNRAKRDEVQRVDSCDAIPNVPHKSDASPLVPIGARDDESGKDKEEIDKQQAMSIERRHDVG